MPKSRTKKSAQRKLDFPAAETSGEQPDKHGDDEVVVVDDEKQQQVREASRKRLAPSPPSRGENSMCTISEAASTPKKGRTTATIVTPAEVTTQKSKQDCDGTGTKEYVPTYIHKNLEYHRKGEASDALPSKTLKVFQLITEHYAIPKDLEQSRSYGPLSGTTYEERVISAYRLGKLRAFDELATIICTGCAETGHERDECPTLL